MSGPCGGAQNAGGSQAGRGNGIGNAVGGHGDGEAAPNNGGINKTNSNIGGNVPTAGICSGVNCNIV